MLTGDVASAAVQVRVRRGRSRHGGRPFSHWEQELAVRPAAGWCHCSGWAEPERGEPFWAASSWAAIRSLTSASSGVSGRRMSARRWVPAYSLVGQLGQFRSGGVDDAHGVIGEVRRLDHPGPRAGGQAGEDVLAVLFVLVAAGLPSGVGDRGD